MCEEQYHWEQSHIIDAKHHIIYGISRNIICGLPQPRSFVPARMRNDVFATLKMMLCLTAQMKKPRFEERGFLARSIKMQLAIKSRRKACMKSAACLRYGINAKRCMESSQSDAWNQSEGEIHADA